MATSPTRSKNSRPPRTDFEAEGDAKDEVDALIALANAELQAGNRDGALLNFNRAAALCTDNKYELGFAQLYADLGLLLLSLGKTQEAEQMMIKSLAIADRLGETAIAALAAGNLSLLYRETQDLDRAEAMARQALRFEGQLERKDGVARASLNLGTILFERARLDEAGGADSPRAFASTRNSVLRNARPKPCSISATCIAPGSGRTRPRRAIARPWISS